MDLQLKGKRALVTGARKGIGFAVAQSLAEEGCHLDLASRGQPALEAARDKLRSAAPDIDIRIHAADLSQAEDQQRLAQACAGVDILVNNAGSNPAGTLDEISDEVWRASWDLKMFGYINLTRAMLRCMKERRAGVIINVVGYAGERLSASYIIGSTGNAGLMAFSRAVGSQSPDFGVRVIAVNPGYTPTDRAVSMLRTIAEGKLGSAERWRDVEQELNLPFGRMGTPREVADVVTFLASSRASYVSGTVVTVDGGTTNRNV
ncbi:MAG: SDR family oxidoreductase [Hyphomicrobiales bacterium]|nr:SDR family oxidoreductase [Hyphomicrobiales bacterium]